MIRPRLPVRVLFLALAATLPLSSFAAGIGQAHVLSRLGEPLRVEIELAGLTESQSVANCYSVEARLPTAAPIAGLREAPLELVARSGGKRLLFRTVTPVSEPLIRLQLRAGCGIELLRSYDLLLPLASDAADVVVLPDEFPAAPLASSAGGAERVAPVRAPVRPKPSAAPTAPAPATAPVSVRPPPASGVSDPAQQAVLAAAAELAAARSEEERAAIVTRLQQTFAQSAVPAAGREAAASVTDAQSVPVAPVAPAAADPASSAAGQPTAEPPRKSSEAPAAKPAGNVDEGFSVGWIFLLALLATLGYWIWHRRGAAGAAASVGRPAPSAPADAGRSVPIPAAVVSSDAANIFRDPSAVVAASSLDAAETPTVSPLHERLAMRSTHPDFDPDMPMPQVEQFDEEAEVIELAELMLQFGRVSGAVDTLRGYLDEAPKAALLPWLRLLEIYRQANQRAEFEDAARHLNKHFNVQVVSWEQANANAEADATAPQTLEGYPRALQGIVDTWGTAAGLDYLNDLLRDNRDGARVGFPPEVAKEILFLISVLKEFLAGDTSPARVRGGVAA